MKKQQPFLKIPMNTVNFERAFLRLEGMLNGEDFSLVKYMKENIMSGKEFRIVLAYNPKKRNATIKFYKN